MATRSSWRYYAEHDSVQEYDRRLHALLNNHGVRYDKGLRDHRTGWLMRRDPRLTWFSGANARAFAEDVLNPHRDAKCGRTHIPQLKAYGLL